MKPQQCARPAVINERIAMNKSDADLRILRVFA
jgi:hypothetical protein